MRKGQDLGDAWDTTVHQSSAHRGRVYVMVYHQVLSADQAEELAAALLEEAKRARAVIALDAIVGDSLAREAP